MRTLIKFSRTSALVYASHLDMVRCVQRTLRRAGLPVQYSQGFNPHPLLSFAQALAVGLTTEGDYFAVGLDDAVPHDELIKRFNANAPNGLVALAARDMPSDEKSPMARVAAAVYRLEASDEKQAALCEGVMALYAMPSYTQQIKGKAQDVRARIFEAACGDRGVRVVVSCGNENLSHKALIAAVCGILGWSEDEIIIRREDLLTKNPSGALRSLLSAGPLEC
jgi:radical SAM-linked protein